MRLQVISCSEFILITFKSVKNDTWITSLRVFLTSLDKIMIVIYGKGKRSDFLIM